MTPKPDYVTYNEVRTIVKSMTASLDACTTALRDLDHRLALARTRRHEQDFRIDNIAHDIDDLQRNLKTAIDDLRTDLDSHSSDPHMTL